MIKKKKVQQWKIDEIKHLLNLFKRHKNVAVIDVARIDDKQIQSIRKILRGKAILRMSKKSLQQRSIGKFKEESKKPNLEEFAQNIPGQASLVFTNIDIYELKSIFDQNKWMVPAKPNEITPVDIWVPTGDTGLPTGQVISELNMILRLPTRIQNDTIWIRDDTRTHGAGEFVDVKQAAVLKKLGVTPIESLIKIHFAWADGELIPADVLYMDLGELQRQIASCYLGAQKLAMELGIMDDETIIPLIQKAYREALGILFEIPILDETLLDEYIRRAELNVNIINTMILGEEDKTPVKAKKTKKKKKKSEDEEEGAAGIGGLFG